jgi:hypothetical protein
MQHALYRWTVRPLVLPWVPHLAMCLQLCVSPCVGYVLFVEMVALVVALVALP